MPAEHRAPRRWIPIGYQFRESAAPLANGGDSVDLPEHVAEP